MTATRCVAVPMTVGVLTALAFLPAVSAPFLNWDDNVNFLENMAYRGLGVEQIRWAWTTALFGHYIPLTRLTWSLNYALGGMDPWGYHLLNVLLHAGNACAFYFVVRRLLAAAVDGGAQDGRRRGDLRVPAAVAALVFGLHPLRAEPVVWITARPDLLCGAFALAATWAYLRAVEGAGRARPGLLLMSAAGLAAALLSKGAALPLPAALLILDAYPLRRVSRLGWLALVREKLPLIVVSGVGAAVVTAAVRRGAVFTGGEQYDAGARVAVAAYNFCVYPLRFVWPSALSPFYEMPTEVSLLEPRFVGALLAVVLVTVTLVFLRRRWPAGLAAWTFSMVMLVPTSLALRLGAELAPDRYSYLSGLGFAALAGGAVIAVRRLEARLGRSAVNVGAGAVAVVALGALAGLTWIQVGVWRDDLTLWSHAVRLDPRSPVALSNLGSALRAAGRLEEAVEHSSRALRHKPDLPEAHLNLGLSKVGQGRSPEAEPHFRRVLELKPRSSPAHLGLASALEAQGKVEEALHHFHRAVELQPGSSRAHNDLGVRLARSGRLEEATASFSRAVRLDPRSPSAQNNLGLALAQTGRLADAVDHFRAALRSEPGHRDARRNLEHALGLLERHRRP